MIYNTIISKLAKLPRITIVIFQILISLFFLFIIIDKINFKELPLVFFNANYLIITVLIIVSLFNNLIITAYRYYLLLRFDNHRIGFRDVISIHISTISLKIILPFKTGSLFRSIMYQRKYNINFLKSFSLFLVIMISNFILLLFLFAVFEYVPHPVRITIIILSLLVGAVLYSYLFTTGRIKNMINYILFSFLFVLIQISLMIGVTVSLTNNVQILNNIRDIIVILVGSEIPITYNGIGIREYLLVRYLNGILKSDQLFSISYWYLIIQSIIPALFGLFFIHKIVNYLKKGNQPK